MKFNKESVFPVTLGISALFVAVVAAFFSIAGIGMLFSGAAMSSMVMASALELGKLTATTFLYRYWKKTTFFLRTYLVVAIIVLMAITSLGVFGWLSSAYQASAMKYEVTQQQISLLVEQRSRSIAEADSAKQRSAELSKLRSEQESRFSEVIKNPVLARNPTQLRQLQEQNLQLIKDTDASIGEIQKTYGKLMTAVSSVDSEINNIKLEMIKTKDVTTFKFVADAFGLDMTTTVKWFIAVIISVFDPLAVCLILSYNVATFVPKKEDDIVIAPIETAPVVPEVKVDIKAEPVVVNNVVVPPEPKPVDPPKVNTGEKSMHTSEYYTAPRR